MPYEEEDTFMSWLLSGGAGGGICFLAPAFNGRLSRDECSLHAICGGGYMHVV
jgi:hypothetical protein